MSDTGVPVTPGGNPPATTSAPAKPSAEPEKPISPKVALTIIIVSTLVFVVAGIGIGRTFFWDRYDRTPLLERQYQAAVQRVKANPNSADAHVELGWSYFQKDQYNEALGEYKKALEIDEKNYKAHFNLGLVYMKTGKVDRAVASYQKAIEIIPNAFQAHYELGKAFEEQGKLEDALKELKFAYKSNPGSVDIIYEQGVVYEKLGKPEDAKYQYESALQFDPKYTKAQEALNRLKKK